MRFYTRQHVHYCGIDLHARSLYVCILDQEGKTLVHRKLPCDREKLLETLAPYREDLAVADLPLLGLKLLASCTAST